jgi:DNA-binding beta-propeller fold protein YncE
LGTRPPQAPHALAADGVGNVYVADTMNHRIRKVVAATGETSTVAGSGAESFANGVGTNAAFSFPYAIATAARGNGTFLYVADASNNCVRRIETSTWNVTTFAGHCTPDPQGNRRVDATGTDARFNVPFGIAVDATGAQVFVSDTYNGVLRQVRMGQNIKMHHPKTA